MATVKHAKRKASRWVVAGSIAALSLMLCIVCWWLWAQRSPILLDLLPAWAVPATPGKQAKSGPARLPDKGERSEKSGATEKPGKAELPEKSASPATGASVPPPASPDNSSGGLSTKATVAQVAGAAGSSARAASGAAAGSQSKQAATASASRAATHPILLTDEGKSTVLDVQSVMALQRSQAERRLYDRVVALSTTGGTASTVAGLAAPRASSADSALKALTGHGGAGQAVASFEARLPAGLPPAEPGRGGNPATGPSIADAVSRTVRLLSVYVREDFWLAEVLLPNGRRIELELHDQLSGFHISRIDETGVLLMPVMPSEGKKRFLAVGDRMILSEAPWRQSSTD